MFDLNVSVFILICLSKHHVVPFTHGEGQSIGYNLTLRGNQTRELYFGVNKNPEKSSGSNEGFQESVHHNNESKGIEESEFEDSNNAGNVQRLRGSSNVTLGDTSGRNEFTSPFQQRAREDAYDVSSPRDSPHSVMLLVKMGETDENLCTGSLLTNEWVLSAAHCVADPSVTRVLVVAGGRSYDEIIDQKPAKGSETINSTEFYPHPKYSERISMYDVSVIKTERKFNLSGTVNTIKLSARPWTYHSYVKCEFTGFGNVQMGEKTTDKMVRKTHRLMVKKPCLCAYRLKALQMSSVVVNTWICMKPVEDFGVCTGDSGGALVCDGEVKAVAMLGIPGIENHKTCEVSKFWTMRCGSKNTASVFQDLCPFLRWINSHVKLYNESDMSPNCVEPMNTDL